MPAENVFCCKVLHTECNIVLPLTKYYKLYKFTLQWHWQCKKKGSDVSG